MLWEWIKEFKNIQKMFLKYAIGSQIFFKYHMIYLKTKLYNFYVQIKFKFCFMFDLGL